MTLTQKQVKEALALVDPPYPTVGTVARIGERETDGNYILDYRGPIESTKGENTQCLGALVLAAQPSKRLSS